MNARCLPLGPREHALNAALEDCTLCDGTGLVRGHRCTCTRPLPRTTFATLAEATEACGSDGWRVPGWNGSAWSLGQVRHHPVRCPRCQHKHHGWTLVCNDCNGEMFGGGA